MLARHSRILILLVSLVLQANEVNGDVHEVNGNINEVDHINGNAMDVNGNANDVKNVNGNANDVNGNTHDVNGNVNVVNNTNGKANDVNGKANDVNGSVVTDVNNVNSGEHWVKLCFHDCGCKMVVESIFLRSPCMGCCGPPASNSLV